MPGPSTTGKAIFPEAASEPFYWMSKTPCQFHKCAALYLAGEQNPCEIREFLVSGTEQILPRNGHLQIVAGPPAQHRVHFRVRGDVRGRQLRSVAERGIPLHVRAQIHRGTYLEMVFGGKARNREGAAIKAPRVVLDGHLEK